MIPECPFCNHQMDVMRHRVIVSGHVQTTSYLWVCACVGDEDMDSDSRYLVDIYVDAISDINWLTRMFRFIYRLFGYRLNPDVIQEDKDVAGDYDGKIIPIDRRKRPR